MNKDTEKLLIAQRAAEWLDQLEHANAEERAKFVKWLKESPQHGWEILLGKSCDTVLPQLFKETSIDVSNMERQPSNVRPIDDRASSPTSLQRRNLRALPAILTGRSKNAWKAVAVLAFVAIFSAATVAIQAVSDRTVSSAAGEWHTAQLADGTLLRVGPRTKVTVELTDRERVVHLIHGEVMLDVAKDHARPFYVETDLATARAVGTAFAVSHVDAARVVVTVKEGVVAVARRSPSGAEPVNTIRADPSITLRAGEQIAITETLPLAVKPVDLRKELAWVNGWLIFDGETVAQAAHEFNLRNRKQIRVGDPVFAQRRIHGTFDAADPDSFVAVLQIPGEISVVHDDPGTLLLVPIPASAERDGKGPREP